MRTMTIISTVFRGLMSLFIIIFFLVQCSTKKTEVPEITTEKPTTPLSVWDKIKKYEPQDVPTPDQIKSQVLALIEKAETRGYKFKTYGYKLDNLFIQSANGAFACYRTSGNIDLVACSIRDTWKSEVYLRDEVSVNKNCPDFGLIRSNIGEQKNFEGIEGWPGIDNGIEAPKKQLDDINKKYLAFLKCFTEEL